MRVDRSPNTTSLYLNSTLLLIYSYKLGPAGGVGALMVMHDAVALANRIGTLNNPRVSDMEHTFKLWHAFGGCAKCGEKAAKVALQKALHTQVHSAAPQVSFLPPIEDNAKWRAFHQLSPHFRNRSKNG
ncbi:MAG: hypothetical protein BYD32DRAFT_434730 [Podila humilis]|nr:MAG: hypothetical protein BYD32DRAFT_434730 [Podila humilis]